ncbi:LysM peptidoglycan-binding domain-containing protein [Leucobacter aridicollis]|uniref:LysM repeat protein n=1 Tax=Leucobacter aridicollis TaxID=283878 RepID=A0A852RA82_9MICO|nr:LysM peptidoglycan-binding domain-containing protein [Leucobacter aridicollis]MBL3681654.1 LysM peptidoglycan-binding domain-containing protein [Leucobacter aridicollis]NYD27309.1 LysM repeat protein [Leucobacter aridicollis]
MTATATVTAVGPRIDADRAGVHAVFSSTATATRAAQSARPAAAPKTRLRLTRRGRAVFGGLATVLIAGALGVAASFAAPGAIANGAASSQEFPYVVAQSGDSLWSIASALEPTADPRDVVAEIQRLNQIQASDLQAGDAIAVPLRFAGSEATFPASDL